MPWLLTQNCSTVLQQYMKHIEVYSIWLKKKYEYLIMKKGIKMA